MVLNLRISKVVVLVLAVAIVSVLAFWFGDNEIMSELEYRQQARQFAQQGNWESLEKLARRWLLDHPQSDMSHVALGDSLRMRGSYAAAAAEYGNALAREAGNHQTWAYHGIMMLEVGDFAQAAASCQKSIILNPRHADGWYCFALSQAELDQTNAANEALAQLAPLSRQLHDTAERIIREHTCKKQGTKLNAPLC